MAVSLVRMYLMEHCDLLEKLLPGDLILADHSIGHY